MKNILEMVDKETLESANGFMEKLRTGKLVRMKDPSTIWYDKNGVEHYSFYQGDNGR